MSERGRDARAASARSSCSPSSRSGLDYPARSLSGGEQQMVVLAQALVSHPRFVIIDELSLGLAPVVINRLVPTIRSVAEAGAGVLLIEQFATLALGLANRAYIMEGGQIQYSGMASELKENPAMLQSAYLLRTRNGAGAPEPVTGAQLTPQMTRDVDRARARAQRRHRRHPRLLLRRGRADGRRAAAARVPRLLALRRRDARACTSPSAAPYAAHAAGLGLTRPRARPGHRAGRPHRVRRRPTTTRLSTRLERRGVAPSANGVPGGPRQVFIEDPNGVRVEINVRS